MAYEKLKRMGYDLLLARFESKGVEGFILLNSKDRPIKGDLYNQIRSEIWNHQFPRQGIYKVFISDDGVKELVLDEGLRAWISPRRYLVNYRGEF